MNVDWIESLAEQGLKPCVTSGGRCWIRVHKWARMCYPLNDVSPIDDAGRRDLFWRRTALIIKNLRRPYTDEKANAYLYLCRDREYSIDKLSANNRSKVRRGLRRHDVRQVSPKEMLRTGYTCVVDSRQRNGVKPQSEEIFRQTWREFSATPFLEIWGAMADDELAAFMTLRFCGSWVQIVSCVSADHHLKNYPNHALFATVLEELLVKRDIQTVSYGLSSFQLNTRADSLHSFKLSVGFEAIPVVREVLVHPLLKPLLNRATRFILRKIDRKNNSLFIKRARALVEQTTGGEIARLPGVKEVSAG